MFYEVIIPNLTNTSVNNEVKIFSIKIAEKIITICQGDLLLSKIKLDKPITFEEFIKLEKFMVEFKIKSLCKLQLERTSNLNRMARR